MSRHNNFFASCGKQLQGLGLAPWGTDEEAIYPELIPPTSVSVYSDTPYVIAQSNPVINPAQAQSGWLDSMLKTAESAAKTFMTYKQANDFNAINLQRARQGLPPLNPQAYAPQINFGVSSDIQQMILWGGAAVLVIMLIGSMRQKS